MCVCAVQVPYVGIDFAVYDTLKHSALMPRHPAKSGSDAQLGEPTVAGKLAAGAVAGAAGQTAAYPLDTVRRILQVQDLKVTQHGGGGDKYAGMLDCLVRLTRRDGIGALYKGLFANYLKVVPSVSMAFVVFETTKQQLHDAFPRR
jgi:solute carrier family 25 phosphate transporter 23/24/25/41